MYALKKEVGVLNRSESEVMNAVYSLCVGKGVCLISPTDLIAQTSGKIFDLIKD